MTPDLDTVIEASPPMDGAPFEVNVRDLDGTRFVSVSGEVDLSLLTRSPKCWADNESLWT